MERVRENPVRFEGIKINFPKIRNAAAENM